VRIFGKKLLNISAIGSNNLGNLLYLLNIGRRLAHINGKTVKQILPKKLIRL